MKRKINKKRHRRHSLFWVLLASFAAFLVISIFVVGISQNLLLHPIYEAIQRDRLRKGVSSVADAVGTDQLDAEILKLSVDSDIDGVVYHIEGTTATRVAQSSTDNNSVPIAPNRLSELYETVKESGEDYLERVTFGGHEVKRSFIEEYLPGEKKADNDVSREIMSLLCVRICTGADGGEYMILLTSPLTPTGSFTNTMQLQYFWIALILFVLSVCISIPLSRRVRRPLKTMNEAAGKLAKGNYDVDFSVGGYRETEELAKTLNFAASELSKTDRMQKELIANISHDLRTPLTMIRGYSEVMRDIPGENTPENMQVIIDETEHLSNLVNDMLDLSRIQSGVRNPVMEYFDLTEAVRETLFRFEKFTRSQGYDMEFEAGESSAFVFADRGMMLQVIYNLLGNAVNYTGEDHRVVVRQTVENGFVTVSVKDTGEGIPEDQIHLIWDRYYKVDRVHRMARIGTGLGLSIAKGVLEVHNAEYGVESKLGEGSTFWFRLPISEPPKDTTNKENETT